jgi:hypothetical protein
MYIGTNKIFLYDHHDQCRAYVRRIARLLTYLIDTPSGGTAIMVSYGQ